jgi:WD40 repeat protein
MNWFARPMFLVFFVITLSALAGSCHQSSSASSAEHRNVVDGISPEVETLSAIDRDYAKLERSYQITAPQGKTLTDFLEEGRVAWLYLSENNAEEWSVENWTLSRKLLDIQSRWYRVSADGTVIVTDHGFRQNGGRIADGFILDVFDLKLKQPLPRVESESNSLLDVVISPNRGLIATADGVLNRFPPQWDREGNVILWNLRSGQRLASLPCENSVVHIAISAAGSKLAFKTRNGSIYAYDISEKRLDRQIFQFSNTDPEPPPVGGSLAFSRDARLLAEGSVHELNIWDLQSGRVLKKLAVPCAETSISPNNKAVLCRNYKTNVMTPGERPEDYTPRLYDVSTGKLVFSFAGYAAARFASDGAAVATIKTDRSGADIFVIR